MAAIARILGDLEHESKNCASRLSFGSQPSRLAILRLAGLVVTPRRAIEPDEATEPALKPLHFEADSQPLLETVPFQLRRRSVFSSALLVNTGTYLAPLAQGTSTRLSKYTDAVVLRQRLTPHYHASNLPPVIGSGTVPNRGGAHVVRRPTWCCALPSCGSAVVPDSSMDSVRKIAGRDRVSEAATQSGSLTVCASAPDPPPAHGRRKRARRKAQQNPILASESLLAQAIRLAGIGTWEYSVERRDFSWSENFFRMFGLEPRQERITVGEACAYIHPADRARMWDDVAKLISSGEPLENEFAFVLPNGETRIFHSRAVPAKDPSGQVLSIRGMSQDVTKQKKVEEDLHRLSQQLMQLRDQERRRMARQLHETAVQSLAALRMTLGRLAEALPSKKGISQGLYDSCLVLVEEAIQEVRTVSYLMHPPMLDMAGLSSALRWFAEGFSKRSGIAVTVEANDDLGRFPQEIETSIFRIVQEALTNVHRHSGSDDAEIHLRHEGAALRLEVTDRGRGLTAGPLDSTIGPSLGVGIAGMRERVRQLKGTFQVESIPGHGTTITVLLPI